MLGIVKSRNRKSQGLVLYSTQPRESNKEAKDGTGEVIRSFQEQCRSYDINGNGSLSIYVNYYTTAEKLQAIPFAFLGLRSLLES